MKAVEVDKVGAAQAADNREPTSVWSKSAGEESKQEHSLHIISTWMDFDMGCFPFQKGGQTKETHAWIGFTRQMINIDVG